jgi:hypothetical protein
MTRKNSKRVEILVIELTVLGAHQNNRSSEIWKNRVAIVRNNLNFSPEARNDGFFVTARRFKTYFLFARGLLITKPMHYKA